jgi:hypothetical protein
MSQQTIFRVAAVIVAIAAFMMSPELPSGKVFEANQAANVRRRIEHARTVPVSNKLITVKFTESGEKTVEVSQFEGGLIRVEIPGKGVYGFSPIISDPGKGSITMKVYRIGQDRTGEGEVGESLIEVDILAAEKIGGKKQMAYTDGDENFKMEIVGVRAESEEKWEAVKAQYESNLVAECCVECGRLHCGCAVATPCGGCCDGGCCHLTQ